MKFKVRKMLPRSRHRPLMRKYCQLFEIFRRRTDRNEIVIRIERVSMRGENSIGSKPTSRSAYRNALIRGGVVSDEEKKSCTGILTDMILGHVDYVIRRLVKPLTKAF